VPDVLPVNNRERFGLSVFDRKTGKIYILIPDCGVVVCMETLPFERT
jgi:hypothetical protein